MAAACCQTFFTAIFHYETIKLVDIRNKKVGALYRFIQLVIISYIIGYVIIYKKGYQEFDVAISSVSTKLKGAASVDFGNFYSPLYRGIQVYDPADYVVPAQENNGFFVMTNMIITPNQTQGRCPEDPKFKDNLCKERKNCQPPFVSVHNGNGVRTGECVPSDRNSSIKVCEIYGWCPTEIDVLPMAGTNFSKNVPLLQLAKDFTVLVKNQITFPKFGLNRRNLISHNMSTYLKNCIYNKHTDPLCPKFQLGKIVEECGYNFTEVAYEGGVFGIFINWDCNFDYNKEDCEPSYQFRRLDDRNAPISPGYNFRYAEHYVVGDKRTRILTKAYGLKFEVLVHGKAGKFSPVPLFTNIGAGVALLSIASVCCDFAVIYLLKKRQIYKNHKYDRLEDDENDGVPGSTSETDDEETPRTPLINR